MKTYGDLIPCWDCGEAKKRSGYQKSRLLSCCNICRPCANRRSREWREKNPERVVSLNKKHVAARRARNRLNRVEDFPRFITCRNCAREKRREEFYPSCLANCDRVCKLCFNERTNRNRRMKKGLPPPEPRPTLPDWSSF